MSRGKPELSTGFWPRGVLETFSRRSYASRIGDGVYNCLIDCNRDTVKNIIIYSYDGHESVNKAILSNLDVRSVGEEKPIKAPG